MFFVGATGQLLTLILTVCLPFVLLVSSQPKLGLQLETANFQNQKKQQEVTSPEIISSDFIFAGIEKNQKISIEIGGIVLQKIPLPEFRVKCKTLYAESSGNKAPPSFNCFCC
jgi:DNA polymerase I-like protein with 3'-5' exonuclease and polymerase domains